MIFVQEFCNGGSLGDAISDAYFDRNQSPLHWRRVLATLLDVAEGMAYIHSMRICHGDLNPANVLLKVLSFDLHLIRCGIWHFAECAAARFT